MAKNILTELRSVYSFLTPVEKKIADILIRDPQEFVRLSTAQLAERAGVAQGSINNFSRKFSSGGISALKLLVAACLPEQNRDEAFTVVDPNRTIKAAMMQKIKANTTAFYNTLELNDEQELQKAMDMILAARNIQTFGVYYSGITASDFCYHLIQLGIPAAYVSDMLMCAVAASMMDETGLLVAISTSGRTKEILEAVDVAKGKGAKILCLTADRLSPLAAKSDAVLVSASGNMSITDSPDEKRLSQMLVLDTLCACLRSRVEHGKPAAFFRLKEILNSHSILD